MKPLILLLLFAISIEAQSLPEIARKERERKGRPLGNRTLNADTIKNQASTGGAAAESPTAPAKPAAKPEEPAKPATAATAPVPAAPPASTATPAAKPASAEAAQKYAEDLAKLRARVVQLQDMQTSLELRLNDFKNELFSPVTDTTARAQAQERIEQAQSQLAAIQKELGDVRRAIQVMEAQGPPKS